MRTFEYGKRVWDLAFSPDGNLLGPGSWDYSARLWDLSTGLEVQCFAVSDTVCAIAFSQDGKLLAVAGQSFGVKIYKLFVE